MFGRSKRVLLVVLFCFTWDRMLQTVIAFKNQKKETNVRNFSGGYYQGKQNFFKFLHVLDYLEDWKPETINVEWKLNNF